MKKIYISALCAMLCTSAAMGGSRFAPRKDRAHVRIARIGEAAKVMRPSSQTLYEFIDGEWIESEKTEFTYDAVGNIISELTADEDYTSRTVSEYNADNMLTSILTTRLLDDQWVNESKRSYTYDAVVKNYCIERLGYDWTNDDWVRNYYCETNDITRNSAGNITAIVKSLPLVGGMYPGYKCEWLYENAEGEATEFNYYMNYNTTGEPEWELSNATSYRNLNWKSFNGQLTNDDIREYVTGDNLLLQADVYYEDELDGHLFVEYKADGGYTIRETYADPSITGLSTSLTYTDSYGSYVFEENEYFDEDGEPTSEPTYTIREEVTINERGDVVSDELFEIIEGESELVDGMRYDYEYYADGNISRITHNIYDYDTADYWPMMRIDYGSYLDCAGVSDITSAPQWQLGADAVHASVTGMTALSVYSLQGVRMLSAAAVDGNATLSTASLPSGIYIVKAEGTHASIRYCK